MLYHLWHSFDAWFESHGLGFFRVLKWIEFRAIASLILSFVFVMLLGNRVIRWLIRAKIGDAPEFYHAELNEMTRHKKNVPTMGGVLIIGAMLFSTLLLAPLTNFYVQMGLLCIVWLGTVGAADDWLKLTAQRRGAGSRDGLYTWEKLVFQIGIAFLLGLFIYNYGENKFSYDPVEVRRMTRALTLPFMKTWEQQGGVWIPADNLIELSRPIFVLLAVMFICGFSNAVNLTDGMDGLASGVLTVVAFAFIVLTLLAGWAANDGEVAKWMRIPYIPKSEELAVLCAAMVGACLGFLWFNCSPAQVFMGDTGSLPLGGLIGYVAVVIRQEFLLVVIGGVFVMEALSVIIQVGYFKASGGKRVFKMAPIHHHFHLMGWTEQQVVLRFWVLSAVLVAIALLTIKLR